MINLENSTIAMQKSGKLTQGTLEWLNANAGTDFPACGNPFDARRELRDTDTGITVVGYSNGDSVKAVACDQVDVGICGGDMFCEKYSKNLAQIDFTRACRRLGFGACRLVIARTPAAIDDPITRLATSYPRITMLYQAVEASEWLNEDTVVDRYAGGIESIGRRNGYDAVIDLMETGQSLAQNDYTPVETIADFEAVLVERNTNWPVLAPGAYDEQMRSSIDKFSAEEFLNLSPDAYARINGGGGYAH